MRIGFSGPRLFGIRPWISFPIMGIRRIQSNPIQDCSFVYVIKDEAGRVKIGSSVDPSRRLKELQTGHPERLSIEFIGASTIDGAILESAAHTALYRYRINNEWFSISTEYAIAAIYGIAAKHDAKIKQVTEQEAQQIMRIMTGLEAMPNNGRRRKHAALWILTLLVWILLVLTVAAPAHARGHKSPALDVSHPTIGECMAAISIAERNDNVWQEDGFTMDDCAKVAGKMIDNGYKMMCEGGTQSACDMGKDD